MRFYKPGIVAVATVRGVPNVRVFRTETFFEHDRHVWASSTLANSAAWHLESDVTDVRPLVVLDLDASERAALRKRALESFDFRSSTVAAIEQQTKPPKPAEPTGLGAVVEDDGRKWVHFGNGCWIMSVPNAALKTRTWDDFSSDVEVQP
ncbi:MAG TPA: hypothetical protein VFJ21_03825 [Mycobacteriales bacterium]|nr:hypothetical protein [Mycobacteriales bacterium]